MAAGGGDNTSEYKILLMNVNGPSKTSRVPHQHSALNQILNDFKPSIVFTQECAPGAKPYGYQFEKISGSLYQKPRKRYRQPGFIYNSQEFSCKRITSYLEKCIKNSTLIQFQRNTGYNDFWTKHSDYHTVFAERVCIVIFESKRNPNWQVLAMSWHGPNNKWHLSDRKMMLQYIFDVIMPTLLLYLRTTYGRLLPIIIGGDFNLAPMPRSPRNSIRWPEVPGYLKHHHEYVKGPIRKNKNKLDFFLSTKDIPGVSIDDVEVYRFSSDAVVVKTQPLPLPASKVLNHDPIKATIYFPTSSIPTILPIPLQSCQVNKGGAVSSKISGHFFLKKIPASRIHYCMATSLKTRRWPRPLTFLAAMHGSLAGIVVGARRVF